MLETGTVLVVSVLSLRVTDKLSYVRNTNCIWWLAFSLYKSLTNFLMLETGTVLVVSVLSLQVTDKLSYVRNRNCIGG
jgi:hypothetical protein